MTMSKTPDGSVNLADHGSRSERSKPLNEIQCFGALRVVD